MASTNIDDFDVLYVLGYRSPLTRRHDRGADYELATSVITKVPPAGPRCLVASCKINRDLTAKDRKARDTTVKGLKACPRCGLVLFCNKHRKHADMKGHERQCQDLQRAKEELASWTERFKMLFDQDPYTQIFDKEFLEEGKGRDVDMKANNKLSWWKSPLEWRALDFRYPCAQGCNCMMCQRFARQAANPHQHALDGYCKAYRDLSFSVFGIASAANSRAAIIETLRMDIHAYRQGISGEISADALQWIIAMDSPEFGLDLCYNILRVPYEHYDELSRDRMGADHAIALDGSSVCSPRAAWRRDGASYYLNPVGEGRAFREIEQRLADGKKLSEPYTGEIMHYERHHFHTADWVRHLTRTAVSQDSKAEVRLLLYVHAIESLKAVGNVWILGNHLPVDIILLIQEHLVHASPVINGSEDLTRVCLQGGDLQSHIRCLDEKAIKIYDHIDRNHFVTVKGSNAWNFMLWTPRFLPFFIDNTKIAPRRQVMFESILTRFPEIESWIWLRSCATYPDVMRDLQAAGRASGSRASIDLRELWVKAFQGRMGENAVVTFFPYRLFKIPVDSCKASAELAAYKIFKSGYSKRELGMPNR